MTKKELFISVKKQATQSTINYVKSIADGKTVSEIAEKEGVKLRTLENHIQQIKNEFNAKNSPHLVSIFFRNKLIK